MKCTAIQNDEFKPVSIQMTFETKSELDFWGSFFNLLFLGDVANKFGADKPQYPLLERLGANISRTEEILSEISKHSHIVDLVTLNKKPTR